MDNSYIIIQGIPTPQVYHDLRKVANLTPPPLETAPKALAGSYVGFLAYKRNDMVDDTNPGSDQTPVGMGRLIGDGALFLQIVDIAVHPDHQGKGIGKGIMKSLVDYVDENAPDAYVSLVAEVLGQGLYPQFGFEDVKPSIGMYRCHRLQRDPDFKKAREARNAAMMRKKA